MSVEQLEKFAPGFAWRKFLAGAGLDGIDHVIVAQKDAFPKIAAIIAETPLDTLRAWPAFQKIDRSSPYLPKRFADARFAFRNNFQQGQTEPQPRWERALAFTEPLGDAIGRIYVARHFSADARRKVEAMVDNMRRAVAQRVRTLTWMSPATKKTALAKLARMEFQSRLSFEMARLFGIDRLC